MRTESKLEPPGFERREFLHGGMRLRYLVGGSGPPLVLVHGLGGAASNWRLVAPALAAERRVVVPDLPGHGGSGWLTRGERPGPGSATQTCLPGGHALDSRRSRASSATAARGHRSWPPATTDTIAIDPYADAVLAVLEHEDALPAPWVGHSLGGLVGLRAAVRRPDAISGLVLAAAAGISSASRVGELAVAWIGRLQPERLVRPHRRRIARSRRGRTLAFGWWGVADPAGFDPGMAEAFLAGTLEHTDTRSAGAALVRSDIRYDLERVGCPCLCLWGSADNWVPLADGMEYARRLQAPLRVIADCGHLLIGERPDAVLRAVRDFLAGLDSG
jgi:pimeloyl-ACP methyl ester carboxylesterase